MPFVFFYLRGAEHADITQSGLNDRINSARVIIPQFFAEGVYNRFPRYVKQELPRGSWTTLCWLISLNSTPAAVTRNKAYPGLLSVQRLVSDSTTLLNPELNNSQSLGNRGLRKMEYNPNDFSQVAINSGQRKINYALTVVDEKLAKAIEALCNALTALPPTHNLDLKNVNEALKEFRYLSQMVAGIKPPGCDPEWPA